MTTLEELESLAQSQASDPSCSALLVSTVRQLLTDEALCDRYAQMHEASLIPYELRKLLLAYSINVSERVRLGILKSRAARYDDSAAREEYHKVCLRYAELKHSGTALKIEITNAAMANGLYGYELIGAVKKGRLKHILTP